MEFNIKFRPFRLEDARFINDLRQIEDMEKMIGGAQRPVAFERDLKWVNDLIMNDNHFTLYWAITEIENDEIIGYTSLSDIDYRNGTCAWSGLKLAQSNARKGYGLQAGLKLLKYVFEQMRMVRISAECQEEHIPALDMMLKMGYVQEALRRKTLFKNGIHNSQWLLSVIDEDYTAIKEKFQL